MGAAVGLGILIVIAHLRPTLPRHGGGPLGSFVGVFVVACATAIALAYRNVLAAVTGWRAVAWLALWLGLLLVEYLLL